MFKGPQLAVTAKPFHKQKYPLVMEPKLDGCRMLIRKENGKVQLLSRTLKPFNNFEELEHDALALPDGYVYDGEVLGNVKGQKPSFKALMHRARAERGKATHIQVQYFVFDIIPVADWDAGHCPFNYLQRALWLDIMLCTSSTKLIRNVKLYQVNTADEAADIHNKLCAGGYEGSMLKAPDSKYTDGKNVQWQKMKPWASADLEVVGIIQANTKFNPDTGEEADEAIYPVEAAGAILCKGYEEGKLIVTKASGFTDAEAQDIWKNKDKYLGRIAEIKYQSITASDAGTHSLLFPSFMRWRDDKEVKSLQRRR